MTRRSFLKNPSRPTGIRSSGARARPGSPSRPLRAAACIAALGVFASSLGAQVPVVVATVSCERIGENPCATVAAPAPPVPSMPAVTELREWQVGYFRRGGEARVVAAFDVSTDALFWRFLSGWGTTTLGSGSPGEWTGGVYALPARPDARESEWDSAVLSGQPRAKWGSSVGAPWDSLLVGFELVAPEDPAASLPIVRRGAVGRARVTVAPPPQPVQRVQISHILLYEHDGQPVPMTLDGQQGAAARALGSTTLGGRQKVGMYWEVYGLAAGEQARVELTIAPVIDSTIHPMDVHPVGVAWHAYAAPSAANEGGWPQGFILDVATLKSGRHHMMVTVVVPGQEPVTVVREINVVVGG